jgi:NADPH-dependent curcumin reductase CurA
MNLLTLVISEPHLAGRERLILSLDQFRYDMSKWIAEDKIKWNETRYEGLENAPKAFMGLFKGENLGRTLVKIGPDAKN